MVGINSSFESATCYWSMVSLMMNYACFCKTENVRATLFQKFVKRKLKTSLVATMVRWCEGGVNLGLLPMTITEEEIHLFCACQLLNCDEGQGQ
jgi:hypothetical protein